MNRAGIGALTIVSLAALLGLASPAQLTRLQPAGGNSHMGLLLTDIHLDPVTVNPRNPKFSESDAIQLLENTKIDDWPAQFVKFQTKIVRRDSASRVDANYPLVDAALKAAADKALTGASFDYVIFTGDMLRHDFPRVGGQQQALARSAAAFVVRAMTRRFNAPVFAALGNNDSDRCDYGIEPYDPFLGAVADEMTVLKGNTQVVKDANADFRKGGYFILPHPTVANQDIIVLNSNFWSKSYLTSYCGLSPDNSPGMEEMNWLDGRLSDAAKNHHGVTLVMHIPPGVDPYSSNPGSEDSLFFTPQFNDMFAAKIRTYKPLIPIVFAGHSHLDDFRSFDEVPGAPWRIGLAVSPWVGNDPGFSTFSYDPKTAAVTDITTFTAAPGSASFTREYGFNDAYHVNGFSAANLDAINSGFRTCKTNCADTKAFETYYKPGSSWSGSIKKYACAEKYFSAARVKSCISQ